MAGMLSKVRKVGGSILQFIGLTTVATKVSGATSKTADYVTIGIIGLVFLLFVGGRR